MLSKAFSLCSLCRVVFLEQKGSSGRKCVQRLPYRWPSLMPSNNSNHRGQQEIMSYCRACADCVGRGLTSPEKEMKTELIPGLQNTRSLPRDQLQRPCVINQLNVTQPITWLLRFCYAALRTILPLSHPIQFWTPRPSSALCIVCVKLYFQSFMSNLNSWQLHSDLDRILNLPWTLNPFCKTHTCTCVSPPPPRPPPTHMSTHIFELDLHSLWLNLSSQVSIHWKQGHCTIGSLLLKWRNHISSALVWGENGPSSFLWYFALLQKLKSLSILSELDKLEQGMKSGWYVWLWTHRSIVSTQMRFQLGIKPTRIPYQQLTFWYNVQKKSHSRPHH